MDQVALPKDSPSKLKKEKSKLNNRKLKKKIKDKKKKLKQRKKKKKHYSSESSDSSSSSTSSSSSSDSSDDETARKHKKKRKKNKDKLKKKKSKKSKNDEKGKKVEKTSDKIAKQITDTTVSNEADVGPNISLSSSKIRAPMTKAEWEKQQSELRWIVDPETGRKRYYEAISILRCLHPGWHHWVKYEHFGLSQSSKVTLLLNCLKFRLIRGSGEIMEEIVSKERSQLRIN